MEKIEIACANGSINTLREVENILAIDNVKINKCLRLAAGNGHLDICQYLIQFSNADPSVQQNSALYHAVYGKYYDVVDFLLNNPMKKAELEYDIIKLACSNYDLNILVLLLQHSSTSKLYKEFNQDIQFITNKLRALKDINEENSHLLMDIFVLLNKIAQNSKK